MANVPWFLNQPGLEYPAEVVRGATYAQTGGGNGVSGPHDLKVLPQAAPDGTVQVLPGGGVAVSRYPNQHSQSYTATSFSNQTVTVPPTGSGGGRNDLVILRFWDPDHEGTAPTPEEAPTTDFWWIDVVQNAAADAVFPYPFVPLAHIRRPANTTIVSAAHIVDLRTLANPQDRRFPFSKQLNIADEQSVHLNSTVWPVVATQTIKVPEWATKAHIIAMWGTVRAVAGLTQGTVAVRLTAGSTVLTTQASRWTTPNSTTESRFGITFGDNLEIPAAMRGKLATVEMLGTKTSGPNAIMDGRSSATLDLHFVQEVL